MATAQKKKTTVKRSVKSQPAKTSAKSAYSAATRSARPAAATSSTASLYQLPFAQKDMEQAGKQAAEKMESMFRASSDAMQQFWNKAQSAAGQKPDAIFSKIQAQAGDVFGNAMPKMPAMPNFNPAEMQEKIAKFSREAAEQMARSTSNNSNAANEAASLLRENAEAFAEVVNVVVTLAKEISAEAVASANKNFSQNVELGKAMLQVRTLNDMFDLGTRFMKTNLDSFFSQSIKLSEKIFQTATEVSEPLNERISESAERISKAMAA